MKSMYYYKASFASPFDSEEKNYLICSYGDKLSKGNVIALPIHGHITVAEIEKELDLLEVFSSSYDPIEVITVIDCSAYLARVEAAKKQNLLLEKMEERVKRFKTLETFQKTSIRDPEMKKLWDEFNKLAKEPETTSDCFEETLD